jgi:CheY-like chemotaxis protein
MQRAAISCSRHKVLYVEDHAVNALLMSALFERIAHGELVVADCARTALAVARDLYPALLMIDLRMPDLHGSELLPLLRRVPGCEHVPAVAVTAEHNDDVVGAGFDELWRKPLDLPNVIARVEVFLAQAAARRCPSPTHLVLPSPPAPKPTCRFTAPV